MIQITNYKGFLIEILKAIIKLCIAGFLIGFLKSYDAIIAIILFLKILHVIYKNIIIAKTKNWILLIGMIVTGFGGMVGENWGVSNNYWEYHEVSKELPLWLPFAWMLAFYFLYSIESRLITFLKNKTISNKLIIAFWLSLLVPAFGEVITINLGVWTYYWPYQIFGVPLYAFICLVFVHMLVYGILSFICKKWKINDIVFT
ncbi:MAG: hypothetical protein CMQ52_05175 [Gammaproteobacteria bacterium]|nr:hypothetical protein [Gammaproteobacteria bacterium]MDG2274878.1 hypothetical protein [Flavobacteriaceae bacterium]